MNKELLGKKERPFKVPENYFQNFEERMMHRIGAESSSLKEKGDVITPVLSMLKPWLAMAAAFVLIAVIYYQVPRLFGNQDELSDIPNNEETLINSLAFIVDENDINELILSEGTTLVLPSDSFLQDNYTEEELASLTYFE